MDAQQNPHSDEARLEAILAETAARKAAQAEPPAALPAGPVTDAPAEPAAEIPEETPAEAPAAPPAAAPAEAPAPPETEPVTEPDGADDGGVKHFLGDCMDLIETVMTSVFVVMMIFTFLFCIADVDGDSMKPTLLDKDRLLVSRHLITPRTGDVLIISCDHAYLLNADNEITIQPGIGKRIVKRLIAQSGQTVDIDFTAGIVYVDGEALDEPYTNSLTQRDSGAFTYPLTVPEGYVFVLGDNRNISKDSRHPDVGLVPVDAIIGQVVVRLLPIDQFGLVEGANPWRT